MIKFPLSVHLSLITAIALTLPVKSEEITKKAFIQLAQIPTAPLPEDTALA